MLSVFHRTFQAARRRRRHSPSAPHSSYANQWRIGPLTLRSWPASTAMELAHREYDPEATGLPEAVMLYQ
jgi:hypothetical protein